MGAQTSLAVISCLGLRLFSAPAEVGQDRIHKTHRVWERPVENEERETAVADLTFSQDSKLRLSLSSSPGHLSLLPGVGEHRLIATVDVESIGLPEALPIQISGELFAQFGNTERWTGMFHPMNVVTLAGRASMTRAIGTF
ncbi:hypothetical protein GCM10027405_31660 [Arthrobacter alkaliphilus]